jgi:hypothetical protein
MSRRRPDSRQDHLEATLRHALRAAADSVEPGPDGLDRIRGKISARYARAEAAPADDPLRRLLRPAVIRVRYALGAVAERFSPEPGRGRWLAWLRPAAAVTTGIFVMAAASWAVAALPQVIAPPTRSHTLSASPTPTVPTSAAPTYPGYIGSYPYTVPPAPAPSCSTGTGQPSPSPSASPSATPSISPSPTTSPTVSPTVTPSSSPSVTASPSPAGSGSASPAAPGLVAFGSAQPLASGLAAAGPAQPSPSPTAQISEPATSPSAAPSAAPAGSPSPDAGRSAPADPCATPIPTPTSFPPLSPPASHGVP